MHHNFFSLSLDFFVTNLLPCQHQFFFSTSLSDLKVKCRIISQHPLPSYFIKSHYFARINFKLVSRIYKKIAD